MEFINQFLTDDTRQLFNELDRIRNGKIYIRNTGHTCSDTECNSPFEPRIKIKGKGIESIYKIEYAKEKDNMKNWIDFNNIIKIGDIEGFLDSNISWMFKDIDKNKGSFRKAGMENLYIVNNTKREWENGINVTMIFVTCVGATNERLERLLDELSFKRYGKILVFNCRTSISCKFGLENDIRKFRYI
jgi:hypothetical protein